MFGVLEYNHRLISYCLCVASKNKPNCWAVLPSGSQASVIVGVQDQLLVLDPYEAVSKVEFFFIVLLCTNCNFLKLIIGNKL